MTSSRIENFLGILIILCMFSPLMISITVAIYTGQLYLVIALLLCLVYFCTNLLTTPPLSVLLGIVAPLLFIFKTLL